jgi:hypothetical protein
MDGRYMIVRYYLKPNGKWDEVTEFKNNYKTKHLQTAKVVLDLKDKQVIKNELNPGTSYEDMLEFYKRLLGSKLDPYLPPE